MKKKKIILTVLASTIVLAAMLFGCAPKSPGEGASYTSEPEADSNTTVLNWSPSSDCSLCHVAEVSSLSNTACLVSIHQDQVGLSCIDCHEDTDALAQVHGSLTMADTKGASRLKETTVDNCLDCHVQAELAEATATNTTLTDSQGTVVNPHDLPVNEGHAEFDTACIQCHKMHEADTNTAAKSKSFCASCHHMEVYSCYTCHE